MRYAKIRSMDIANGDGMRVSLFVQGCAFQCEGCFNVDSWDFIAGNPWNDEIQRIFIDLGRRDYIAGYSILGGEPLMQGRPMLDLVKALKRESGKSVWMWTGFKYEDLNESRREIVSHVDVLVDGKFVISKKDLTLQFRGSSNQRIIDVKETKAAGKVRLLRE